MTTLYLRIPCQMARIHEVGSCYEFITPFGHLLALACYIAFGNPCQWTPLEVMATFAAAGLDTNLIARS